MPAHTIESICQSIGGLSINSDKKRAGLRNSPGALSKGGKA